MILSTKQLQAFFDCSEPTALKRKKMIKKELGIKTDPTAYHLSEFLRVPLEIIERKLK